MPEQTDSISIFERVRGKYTAGRALAQFIRYFENWREVWSAYRINGPTPPLRLRGGITLHHGAGDDPMCLFREVFVDECYNRGGFYHPRPGDTVVDIGANIGTFALYLQWRAPGVHVHCFEPGDEAGRRLRNNIEQSHLTNFAHVHPYAVSDRSQTAVFQKGKLTAQNSFFRSEFSGDGTLEVQCLSLEDALKKCGSSAVDLLKIDAEGAEIEIAEGASGSVWEKIRRVSFEFHDRFRPGCRQRVENVLRANGFDDIRIGLISPLEGMGIVHARKREYRA